MDIFLETYNYENSKQWLMDYESLLLKCVFVYIVAIFSLKFVMANRKPFDLQMPLIIWNGLLAVFSIAGFIRITPTFISTIMNKGIAHTYTEIGELQKDPIAGYWAFAWCVSKIPELIDTLFVVLRKRPLMFMHWYHHALTGYFAFVTFYEENAYMVWVVWLNYFIHSFMYSYYCARAIRIRVPPQLAQLLTFAQICQFMITHAVMGHLLWLCYSNTNKVYAVTKRGFFIGAFMEVTYILLWFRFYYISYIANGGKKYTQHRIATQNGKIQQKIE
uniref:Elongation of very long chain fatty acids protein n=1 Tax=Meloidogyne floridensis TaxID=298350 RepID=A0A915P087_9BILA